MKKVIIIGGGFAGTQVAKTLESKFQVILIDTKDYFEFTPGILRLAVEPECSKKIRIPHKSYLKKAKVLKGSVNSISGDYVVFGNKKLEFDYLVLATGAKYGLDLPGIKAGKSDELLNSARKLKKAKNILIVGGGLVGVELAGEIIEKYPDKTLTIIHAKGSLIERNHPKAISHASEFLEKRNVRIIYKQRAKVLKNSCITEQGKEVPCDLIYICTGISPNTTFMKQSLPEFLDESKKIRVNPYLQLRENIFAAGDLNNITEEKTAQAAEKQAKVISQNIINLESKKPLLVYSPKKKPMVISLGKYNGIFEYNNIVLTGKIPALIKWLIQFKTLLKYR
ncbi:hypothetical protein CO038_02910 [Candidatus Pacearchaeota archaeon CG_4_9_14_0_2_um_filter_39_13]|nr:FAD-dependent oxidoreductase [Candidatus Pacearchaeota archaeon]OIO44386.1 MAG: hypothetical protein AUJ64_00210 [Candidatus Pacearchaeota archaeon CG1_02_39_14]PJC44608.1 MAG: hypothetical protein CO038_02910 [Candidatus Pacearchaeota archaeon CG_4_9_14_0_2_um_filter_39_13]